jgi:hypothetical protein
MYMYERKTDGINIDLCCVSLHHEEQVEHGHLANGIRPLKPVHYLHVLTSYYTAHCYKMHIGPQDFRILNGSSSFAIWKIPLCISIATRDR